MKRTFENVAHFYIGCEILTKKGVGTFSALRKQGTTDPKAYKLISSYDLERVELGFHEVDPILKPMSLFSPEIGEDITKNIAEKFNLKDTPEDNILCGGLLISELAKDGWDVFGLIDVGEAVTWDDVPKSFKQIQQNSKSVL